MRAIVAIYGNPFMTTTDVYTLTWRVQVLVDENVPTEISAMLRCNGLDSSIVSYPDAISFMHAFLLENIALQ